MLEEKYDKISLKTCGYFASDTVGCGDLIFLFDAGYARTPYNNPKLTDEMIAMMNKQYGLDKPLWQQYLKYLFDILHGDFGTSYQSINQSVTRLISQRLGVSVHLGIQALVVGISSGLFVGAVSARNKNNKIDAILSVISTLGISVPAFIIGLLLLDYFGFKWALLPLSGWGTFGQTILPTLALAIPVFAQVTRFFRSEMIETLNSDYIQLARAKGLTKRQVTRKHAYRNSMIPVLTLVGPMAANILTGSALIEQIFFHYRYWATICIVHSNKRLSCDYGNNDCVRPHVDGSYFDN